MGVTLKSIHQVVESNGAVRLINISVTTTGVFGKRDRELVYIAELQKFYDVYTGREYKQYSIGLKTQVESALFRYFEREEEPEELEIKVSVGTNGTMPAYATEGSAGCDLTTTHDIELYPMEREIAHTGLRMVIPQGYEGQIRPRSGLSIKQGVTLINCVGTIDSDYRGEIGVPLVNLSKEVAVIPKGTRVAQMVFSKVERAEYTRVDTIEVDTERGTGGFGSTGTT